MLKVDRVVNKVHWFEGMLLSPQHFQQAELRLENLITHLAQRTSGFHWGVIDFDFDRAALASNKLKVSSLHCVMPDGLIVQYQYDGLVGQGDEALELDLNAIQSEEKNIQLSLIVARDGEGDSSDSGKNPQRYKSVNSGLTADRNEASKSVEVVRLHPKLQLSPDREIAPNYVSVPLVSLRKQSDGLYAVQEFTPPILQVGVNKKLGESNLAKQLELVIAKARTCANQLRALMKSRELDYNRSQSIKNRVVLLTAKLNGLELLLQTLEHPYTIFRSLVEYASDIAQLRDDPVAPSFNQYIHTDIDSSFFPVIDFIGSVVAEIRVDFTVLTFDRVSPNTFSIDVTDSYPLSQLLVSFSLPYGQSQEDVARWVESAYICEASDYEDFQFSRSLGFERLRVESFEKLQLKEASDEVFFVISGSLRNQQGRLLISESDETISASRPVSISLMIEMEG